MELSTRLFGDINIEDDKVLTFENGLMGFEGLKKYAIIFDSEQETKKGIMWLQSLEDANIAFPVMDPMSVDPEYNPEVEEDWLIPLGEVQSVEDYYILTVLTVPSDISKMTANLKAPLIMNTLTKKGCQIIVNNDNYPVRFNVYEHVQKLKSEGGTGC